MSEFNEWKVEALTDGMFWTDLTQFVQDVNIKIGGSDDLSNFETGSAQVKFINTNNRFDNDLPTQLYRGKGRINFAIDSEGVTPTTPSGVPQWWFRNDTDLSSIGNPIYTNDITPVSGVFTLDSNSNNAFVTNGATRVSNNNVYEWAYVDPSKLNRPIKQGDYWSVSVDMSSDGLITHYGIGFELLDDTYTPIDRYTKVVYPTRTDDTFERVGASFQLLNGFVSEPRYIRMFLSYVTNTTLPNPVSVKFRKPLLENSFEILPYIEPTNPKATFMGLANRSPVFLETGKPFDINTQFRISARSRKAGSLPPAFEDLGILPAVDQRGFIPKFQGILESANYSDSIDGYPIATFSLVDQNANLNNKILPTSGHQAYIQSIPSFNVPTQLPSPGALPLEGFNTPYRLWNNYTRYTYKYYFPFSFIRPKELPTYIDPEALKPNKLFVEPAGENLLRARGDFETPYVGRQNDAYAFQTGNTITIPDPRRFASFQPPIAPGLNESVLFTSQTTNSVAAAWPLPNFLRLPSQVDGGCYTGIWVKPVNIPTGGLKVFDFASQRNVNAANIDTDLVSSLAVFINDNGSITFRSVRPSNLAVTNVSTGVGYVDPFGPINISIFIPHTRANIIGTGQQYTILAFVNGKFCLDLFGLVSTADAATTNMFTSFRISANAGGSFYMSDFYYQPIDEDFRDDINPIDFSKAYNIGVDIDYEPLHEKTKFINVRNGLNIETIPPKINETYENTEALIQSQFVDQPINPILEELANSSYGYSGINNITNNPIIYSRRYLAENQEATEWVFSDNDVQINELKFTELEFERNNNLITNTVRITSPQKFDLLTKEPLPEPTLIIVENPKSIDAFDVRPESKNVVNVLENVNASLGTWLANTDGEAFNRVKSIIFTGNLRPNNIALTNIRLGHKIILKRTIPRGGTTTITKVYRVVGINWKAEPMNSVCAINVIDLTTEGLDILNKAKTDSARVGF